MNYGYLFAMFGPIMIGAGLLASSDLIAGLADADMYQNPHTHAVVKAKKLDENNDGLITLNELTGRENRSDQKLGRKADGQVDKAEFNARLGFMFNRMDSNGDGMLDDAEISRLKHHHHGKGRNSKRL